MSSGSTELKERLAQLIPEKRLFSRILPRNTDTRFGRSHSKPSFGWCSWCQVCGLETSLLDPEVRFLFVPPTLAASFDITKINRVSDSEDARSRIFRRNYLQLSKVVNRLLRVFCGFFSPETFPRKLNATVSRRNFTLVPSFRLMSRT